MNPVVLGDFLDLCNNLKVVIRFLIEFRKLSELAGCIVTWKTLNRLLIIPGESYSSKLLLYAIGNDGVLH